nr:hypothetical protein [Tanacetum cinerariifolium]
HLQQLLLALLALAQRRKYFVVGPAQHLGTRVAREAQQRIIGVRYQPPLVEEDIGELQLVEQRRAIPFFGQFKHGSATAAFRRHHRPELRPADAAHLRQPGPGGLPSKASGLGAKNFLAAYASALRPAPAARLVSARQVILPRI